MNVFARRWSRGFALVVVIAVLGNVALAEKETDSQLLDQYFRQILEHATSQVSTELQALPAARLMFHGTAVEFDAVEARPNARVGIGGVIDWQGTAIFATADPRVALHYTARRQRGIGVGIDLRSYTAPSEPVVYYLSGGKSLEDAVNRCYGEPGDSVGYLHVLDRSKFVWEQGLGKMEMITRDETANLERVDLDVRAAVDALVESGAVKIHWVPER